MNDYGSYVKCPLCDKTGKIITQHLREVHNLSKEDFAKLYPECSAICSNTFNRMSKNMSIRNTKDWQNPEYRAKHSKVSSKTMTRLKHDPEFEALRVASLSKDSYLAPMRERVKKQYYDLNMASILLAGRMTEEARKHRSELSSRILKERWKDEEFRKKIAGPKNGYLKTFHLYGREIRLRSFLEFNTYRYLEDHGIAFEYEPFVIEYRIPSDDYIHRYHFDFYVPDKNFIIEVKPITYWNVELNQIKMKACIEQGYKFTFSGYDEISSTCLIDILNGEASPKMCS